jgi:hypothetical protein
MLLQICIHKARLLDVDRVVELQRGVVLVGRQ